jgi:hypothetical protein
MVAIGNQDSDCPIDGRQICHAGQSGHASRRRQVGIELDPGPVAIDRPESVAAVILSSLLARGVPVAKRIGQIGGEVDEGAGRPSVEDDPAGSLQGWIQEPQL